MGYRNYISKISKADYDSVKDCKDLESFYESERNSITDLHELGKYVDRFDENLLKPFFTNETVQKEYESDCELYIAGKDFMKAVIDRYNKKVQSYYNEMLEPFFGDDRFDSRSEFIKSMKTESGFPNRKYTFDLDKITPEEQTQLWNIINHMADMRTEWTFLTPYDLDNDSDEITDSWKYEYSIFELVRIYKTFDWENDIMVYRGR